MIIFTDAIDELASTIDAKNSELTSSFSDVERKMNALKGAWSGAASELILAKYGELYQKTIEGQRLVLSDYVGFLHSRVASGYGQVEETNTSLGDAFK